MLVSSMERLRHDTPAVRVTRFSMSVRSRPAVNESSQPPDAGGSTKRMLPDDSLVSTRASA